MLLASFPGSHDSDLALPAPAGSKVLAEPPGSPGWVHCGTHSPLVCLAPRVTGDTSRGPSAGLEQAVGLEEPGAVLTPIHALQ